MTTSKTPTENPKGSFREIFTKTPLYLSCYHDLPTIACKALPATYQALAVATCAILFAARTRKGFVNNHNHTIGMSAFLQGK